MVKRFLSVRHETARDAVNWIGARTDELGNRWTNRIEPSRAVIVYSDRVAAALAVGRYQSPGDVTKDLIKFLPKRFTTNVSVLQLQENYSRSYERCAHARRIDLENYRV